MATTMLLIHTKPIDLGNYVISASTFLINKKEWNKLWKRLRETETDEFEIYKSCPPNEYTFYVKYTELRSCFKIVKTDPNEVEILLIKEINAKETFLDLLNEFIETENYRAVCKLIKNCYIYDKSRYLHGEFEQFKEDFHSKETNVIKVCKLFIKQEEDKKNIRSMRSLY